MAEKAAIIAVIRPRFRGRNPRLRPTGELQQGWRELGAEANSYYAWGGSASRPLRERGGEKKKL